MTTNIEYIEESHTYLFDGQPVKSVTELAKEFSHMDTSWLEAHPEYAERGTQIHNEISLFFSTGELPADLKAVEILNRALVTIKAGKSQTEVLVYNTEHQYAGTVDLVEMDGKKCTTIVDFKSGISGNIKYYTCQLNLYRLAMESMGVDVSETKMLIINPAEVIEIPAKSWDELVNIVSADDLTLEEENINAVAQLEARLGFLAHFVDEYEETKKDLINLLTIKFEEQGKKKFESGKYKYTYVPGTTRRSLDTKLVKEKYGDLDDCMKETTTKATIRFGKIGE